MVSFMAEVIGIRDDMYIGKGNAICARWPPPWRRASGKGSWPSGPAWSTSSATSTTPPSPWPTCSIMINHFGGVENLYGKKIAMSWAYSPSYGKPLSVPQGIIGLMTRFGMEVVLAHPPGTRSWPRWRRWPRPTPGERRDLFQDRIHGRGLCGRGRGLPKSWAPFAAMEKRTELYGQGDQKGIKALEKELLAQNSQHKDWECTEELMASTGQGQGPLPALPPGGHQRGQLRAGGGGRLGLRALPGPNLPGGGLQALHHRGHDPPGPLGPRGRRPGPAAWEAAPRCAG